ncbi:MAG: DUF975 family protein [Lachnospiraceae bacterium]
MWTRAQLKENGKLAFYRSYWECVAVTFLMGIFGAAGAGGWNFNIKYYQENMENLSYVYSPEAWHAFMSFLAAFAVFGVILTLISIGLKIFVGNVFTVGGSRFFILNRTQKTKIGTILSPFRSGEYGNVVLTMFLMDLYIFLWSLLLVVPGIIKSYEYLMVPYILAENPGMDRREAFAISKRMMDGEKWNTFVLSLSFLGWVLLSGCTCGILTIFFVNPYAQATYTELYTYNKIKAYNEGFIR